MQFTSTQKREYQRILRRIQRGSASAFAMYQTPHLFEEPRDSQIKRKRSVGFFPKIQSVWDDVAAFVSAPRIRRGIHSVWHKGLPIELELSRERSETLLVVFHGALEHYAVLPIFPGANVTSSLDVARVSLSDPSLYLSPTLPLAWFAGSQVQPDLQDVTTRLIEKLLKSTGAKRLIFFGSSGGGFASLIQAVSFPGSVAVVANAQTDVLRYHEDHVRNYLSTAWDNDRVRFVENVEFSAIEAFRKTGNRPKIVYMQNSTDTFHVNGHLRPFIGQAGNTPHIDLLFDDWGIGHVPPPKWLIHSTLQAVSQDDFHTLDRLGFSKASSYKFE